MIVLHAGQQAQAMFQRLLERGVMIRPLTTTGLPNCLRISVGTPEENEFFIQTLSVVTGTGN